MNYIKTPMDIEKRSFEIIGEEMGSHNFDERELLIAKRVIHTTADFDYKNILYIREGAIDTALDILRQGARIYTDTTMAASGINKRALKELNCNIVNYVSDPEIAKEAKSRGITRSMAAVERAAKEGVEIFVFGNAPTALFKLKELILKKECNAKFIIASPIGFVGAAESKIEIEKIDIPMIVVRGRKGGSAVAASIMNALMYMIVKR